MRKRNREKRRRGTEPSPPASGARRHRPLPSAWEPLLQVAQALEEAHYFWHQCQASYHDPSSFHANLNALIQAVRNVTWRLQAHREEIPNFDAWYEPWQAEMRSKHAMRWLKEARNQVVKRKGLETRSRATVSITFSYLQPAERTLDLPAALPTPVLVARICASVPPERLGYALVEIDRRWEVDDLPGLEILDAIADCFRVLLALVDDAQRQVRGVDPAEDPSSATSRTALPECLRWSDDLRKIRINPATGETYEWERRWMPMPEAIKRVASDRYGIRETARAAGRIEGDDPLAYAGFLVDVARRVLKKDGYHQMMLFLHRPEGGYSYEVYAPQDQLDKYVMWADVAKKVEQHGYDGFIHISEVWIGPVEVAGPGPYPRVAHRREGLQIAAASAHGRQATWLVPFKKRFGKVVLGKTEKLEDFELGFAAPVIRAWKARSRSRSASSGTQTGA